MLYEVITNPVLSFRATCPGMNCQKRIVLVVFSGEHALNFKAVNLYLQLRKGCGHFFGGLFIFLFQSHFKQQRSIFPGGLKRLP